MLHQEVRRRPASESNPQPLLAGATAIAACLATFGLTLSPGGTLLAVAGATLLVAALLRPALTTYLAITMIALADWHLTPDTTDGQRLVYSLGAYGIPLTPLEIVLLVGALGMGLRWVHDDKVPFRPGELLVPLALVLLAVVLGATTGILRGGVDWPALRSETRGFLYLPVLYLAGAHFFRTPGSVTRLMWFFVIVVNVMAAESTIRYFLHVRTYKLSVAPDMAFGHDNAILCAAAIIFLVCQVIWSPKPRSEWKSVAFMVVPIVALMVMRRRAGMIALETGMILLCFYLLRCRISTFFIGVPLAVIGAGLLLALTWNSPGGTGQFARSFRHVTGQEVSERDLRSNTYREMENVNIRINVRREPITGLGYGQPYDMYADVPNLSGFWPLWRYVPHNTLVGLWMKGGVLAFAAFLALVGTAIARSTQLAMALRGDRLQPAAFAAAIFVVMFTLYSYVDLGLVEPRALGFLGFTLGLIAAISRIVREGQPEAQFASR